MKNLRIAATVVGLLTALTAWRLAQSSGAHLPVHATKGIVKFVGTHTLVITRTAHDGREITFVLSPRTARSGDIEVGSTVDIRFRTDADKRIATAVTVVRADERRTAARVGKWRERA